MYTYNFEEPILGVDDNSVPYTGDIGGVNIHSGSQPTAGIFTNKEHRTKDDSNSFFGTQYDERVVGLDGNVHERPLQNTLKVGLTSRVPQYAIIQSRQTSSPSYNPNSYPIGQRKSGTGSHALYGQTTNYVSQGHDGTGVTNQRSYGSGLSTQGTGFTGTGIDGGTYGIPRFQLGSTLENGGIQKSIRNKHADVQRTTIARDTRVLNPSGRTLSTGQYSSLSSHPVLQNVPSITSNLDQPILVNQFGTFNSLGNNEQVHNIFSTVNSQLQEAGLVGEMAKESGSASNTAVLGRNTHPLNHDSRIGDTSGYTQHQQLSNSNGRVQNTKGIFHSNIRPQASTATGRSFPTFQRKTSLTGNPRQIFESVNQQLTDSGLGRTLNLDTNPITTGIRNILQSASTRQGSVNTPHISRVQTKAGEVTVVRSQSVPNDEQIKDTIITLASGNFNGRDIKLIRRTTNIEPAKASQYLPGHPSYTRTASQQIQQSHRSLETSYGQDMNNRQSHTDDGIITSLGFGATGNSGNLANSDSVRNLFTGLQRGTFTSGDFAGNIGNKVQFSTGSGSYEQQNRPTFIDTTGSYQPNQRASVGFSATNAGAAAGNVRTVYDHSNTQTATNRGLYNHHHQY